MNLGEFSLIVCIFVVLGVFHNLFVSVYVLMVSQHHLLRGLVGRVGQADGQVGRANGQVRRAGGKGEDPIQI